MKKVKRFLFTMLTAIIVVISVFALTACNKNKDDNDNPDNSTQQDRTLTADEAYSRFSALKIDLDKDIKISMSLGYGNATYFVKHSGDDLLFRVDQGVDGENTIFLTRSDGKWGEFNSYVEYNEEGNSVRVKNYRIIEDWEYAEMKMEMLDTIRNFSGEGFLNSIAQGNSMAVLENGDAAKLKCSGNIYSDGSGMIEGKLQVLNYGNMSNVSITANFNADGALTNIIQTSETPLEYRPDDGSKSDNSYANIEVRYEDVEIPVNPTGYERMTSGPVSIYYEREMNAMSGYTHDSVIGGGTVEIPAPVIDGVQFEGWYYDFGLKFPVPKSGDNYVVKTPENKGKGRQYIYAKWEAAAKPTLVLNGGTLDQYDKDKADVTYILGEFTEIEPTLAGKAFAGWYLDPEFTEALSYNAGIVKNATLYAKYVDLVRVVLSVEGINYKLPDLIGAPGERVYAPSKIAVKGYFFDGWFLDKECTQPVENARILPESNKTYYAKLTKGINVNLDGNGASVPKYITIPETGELNDFMAILDALQLKGSGIGDDNGNTLLFNGWVYADGSPITYYPTKEVSVRAEFKMPIQIALRYDSSVALHTADSLTVQQLKWSYETLSEALENYMHPEWVTDSIVIPEGYYLDGWYVDEALTVKVDENTAWPSVATTYYAQFLEIPRFVFVLNGGQFSDNWMAENLARECVYENIEAWYEGSPRKLFDSYGLLPANESTGGIDYRFVCPANQYLEGWYLDEDLTERFTEYDKLPDDGKAIKLYAKYADITYMNFAVSNEHASLITISVEPMSIMEYYGYLKIAERNETTVAHEICVYKYLDGMYLYDDESNQYRFEGKLYSDGACTIEFDGQFVAGGSLYLKFYMEG